MSVPAGATTRMRTPGAGALLWQSGQIAKSLEYDDRVSGRGRPMKLLIAVPALNEAEAIDDIIRRSLAARDVIIAESPVDEIEITIVSDGSTDKTVERASRYTPDVNLIVFP